MDIRVDENTRIADVMKIDRNIATVFIQYGMLCFSCPHASMETLAQAAPEHGIDTTVLVNALNDYLASK